MCDSARATQSNTYKRRAGAAFLLELLHKRVCSLELRGLLNTSPTARQLGCARRWRRAPHALAQVAEALLADGQLHLRRGPQLPAQRRALADMQQTSDLCSASIRLG